MKMVSHGIRPLWLIRRRNFFKLILIGVETNFNQQIYWTRVQGSYGSHKKIGLRTQVKSGARSTSVEHV